MNFRTTLILLVLVAAGLIFVFISNSGDDDATSKTDSPTEVTPGEGRKLLDIKTDDVKSLVIRPGAAAGGQPIELTKSGTDWRVTQPAPWKADDFEARNLVDDVLNLRSRGKVDLGGGNRATAGLDQPRYVIEISDGAGKTTKLTVGNQLALGNDVYVVVDNADAAEIVTAGSLAGKLDDGLPKLAQSLREKSLLDLSAADVKQARVTRQGRTVALSKQGDDWKITQPEDAPGDADAISGLLSTVVNLRADEFVAADAPEATGARIDQPRAVVWLSKEAPSTQPTTVPTTAASASSGVTVAFGQYADVEKTKVFVKVGDTLAKVSLSESTWKEIADASPLALRDRRILDVDPDQVSQISVNIDRPATTQPTTKPAEQTNIVLARRPDEPAPATQPTTAPTTQVATGGPVPTVRPTTGPAAATQPVVAAATTQPETTQPLSKWVLTSADGATADDEAVQSLLDALHPLLVEKYVEAPAATQPATQPTFAAKYVLSVTTVAPGGKTESHELRFTDPGSAGAVTGSYTGLNFEVERSLLDKLSDDFAVSTPSTEPANP